MVERMKDEVRELRNIIEAALLASEIPLSVQRLRNLFAQDARPEKKEIEEALELLSADCEQSSLELTKIDKGWRLQTKEKYAPWLRKLRESRPPRYSRALLETLAVIAYRQPVTRADIEDIRGVSVTTDMMRTLIDREWISQVGYRDVPGRPALWGTTSAFLAYFSLNSLSDLPELTAQRDINDIARELNMTLPIEEKAQPANDDVMDEVRDDEEDNEQDNNEDDTDTDIDGDETDTASSHNGELSDSVVPAADEVDTSGIDTTNIQKQQGHEDEDAGGEHHADNDQTGEEHPSSNHQPAQEQSLSNHQPAQEQSLSNHQPAQELSLSNHQPAQELSLSNHQPAQEQSEPPHPTGDNTIAFRAPSVASMNIVASITGLESDAPADLGTKDDRGMTVSVEETTPAHKDHAQDQPDKLDVITSDLEAGVSDVEEDTEQSGESAAN